MKAAYPKTVYKREVSVFLLRVHRSGFPTRSVLAISQGSLLHATARLFKDPMLGPFLPALFDLHEAQVIAPPRWLRLECERIASRSARATFGVWARHTFLTPRGPSKTRDPLPLPSSMERCPSCIDGKRRSAGYLMETCEDCLAGIRWKGGKDPGDRFYLRWLRDRSCNLSTGRLSLGEEWIDDLPEGDGPDVVHVLTEKLDLRVLRKGMLSLSESESHGLFCVFSELDTLGKSSSLYVAIQENHADAMRSWKSAERRAAREEKKRLELRILAEQRFDVEYAKILNEASF